jgi:DNA-binding GntR family transcriptional regulator
MTRPVSRVDELATKISAAIMTGELPVGTWLRQEALAETFGVSRQPIREALRQVQASGLVQVFPHRGALVRGPSPRDIREAYLVRGELEGLAAELATVNRSPESIEELRRAEEGFRQTAASALQLTIGDDVRGDYGWGHANDMFHRAVLVAADVPVLQRTIEDLHRVVPRNLTWSAIRSRRLLEENVHQHEVVRAAIETGDAPAARAAMTEHIKRSGDLIAEWFERRQRVDDASAA